MPGLPDGMRISTSWRSANRLSACAAPSRLLQSKCAPATVCTWRSLQPAARAAARIAIGGLLGEQRLVAPDGVDRAQLALQVRGETVGGELHDEARRYSRRTDASRRSTCETMSLCIAR